MKPDILFWFYKEFDICKDRLKCLRESNSDIKIFALYGGPLDKSDMARDSVHMLVDDFYAYHYEKNPEWKWKHGEQLISTWFVERGNFLEWDTVFVMQWDMLILAPIENLFSNLRQGEILLSGFKPLKEIDSWWSWGSPENPELLEFKKMLKEKYSYESDVYACLFIVVCLPRTFLEQYANIGAPETGFLEYKFPTLAKVFNTPICKDKQFDPWWAANPETRNAPWEEKTLNAVSNAIPTSAILAQLANDNGKRIFHPVFNKPPSWIIKSRNVKLLIYAFKIWELIKNITDNIKSSVKGTR
ncbi:hypothetical protein ACFL3A_00145 [Pseudomonadota bacterium]